MTKTYWNSWTLPRCDVAVDITSKLHISQLAAHSFSHLQVHNGTGHLEQIKSVFIHC